MICGTPVPQLLAEFVDDDPLLMLVGAVHGYRGLVRELIAELKRELKAKQLPVVATGGYAGLMAHKLPEITAVDPLLTLEGLRLVWKAHYPIGDH